jgi:hypothetical protein
MSNPLESNNDRRILLDALVSYADACVVPHLTPSCPFYVLGRMAPSARSSAASCSTAWEDSTGRSGRLP